MEGLYELPVLSVDTTWLSQQNVALLKGVKKAKIMTIEMMIADGSDSLDMLIMCLTLEVCHIN